MSRCSECKELICEDCSLRHMGCAHDSYNRVCSRCFETVFNSRKRYCNDADCSCSNKSPRTVAKQQREEAQFEEFKRTFDVVGWKAQHSVIDYPSVHKDKHLIDLFLSNDSFEHGYIAWLVKAGSPSETSKYNGNSSPSFMDFVREARLLLACVKKTRLGDYNLRE